MEKKDNIRMILLNMLYLFYMDIPSNIDEIVDYIHKDINETTDPENWSNGDVVIGFRHWIESKSVPEEEQSYFDNSKNYFDIVHKGYQPASDREEIQIHAGENGNLILSKTNKGFNIDIYGQTDIVHSLYFLEDDLK